MKLRMEPANKQEIQFLKSQGALGKRAPSCSLLTRDDMVRLLESFGKRAVAERLRVSLSVPPDMKSYAGFLYIPSLDPSMLPADTVPVPSRRRRAPSAAKSAKNNIDCWDSEVNTPPPPEPVDKQVQNQQQMQASGNFMVHENPATFNLPNSHKRSSSDMYMANEPAPPKVRKLTYNMEHEVATPMMSQPCKCPDCQFSNPQPYSNTVYSQFLHQPHRPYYPPHHQHGPQPPHQHIQQPMYHQPMVHQPHHHQHPTMYHHQPMHMYSHQPMPMPMHSFLDEPPSARIPTPPPIQVEPSILGNDCTLLTASKNLSEVSPQKSTCKHAMSPGCVCADCNVPSKEDNGRSPLPPLFKLEAPSPFGDIQNDLNAKFADKFTDGDLNTDSEFVPHASVTTGTPVANLDSCELTEWYFGQ
jgi:hypothetical protein